jgi:cytochrome P450
MLTRDTAVPKAALRERPPGPPSLPFVGHWWSFARDPLGFFGGLAHRYGDLVRFRLGGTETFYLNHPDHIREVLIGQRAAFTISPLRERLEPVGGHGLFTSKGELHARQRRLMQPVFRKARIEAYAACMSAYAERLRDRWRPGAEIDIAGEMMKTTMFVATKSLFDHDIEGDSDAVSRAVSTLFSYFTLLLSPVLKVSLRFPLPSTRRFRSAARELDAVIYRMIAQRRASPRRGEDLLSLLMQARDDETQAQMTEKQLRDELVTLLIAGHETTANVLAWTHYCLAQSPQAYDTLAAESRALLAGRAGFAAADTERMGYARKVILEGLRLYPPGWFIGRVAIAEARIGGCTIPKGAIVLMSQYVLQRDARFYDEPLRFLPGRWSEEFESKLPRGAYFPFSAGDRHCLGENFAWQEALLILSTLAERWRLELVPGQDIRPKPSLTLRPNKPIRMIVRAR